MCSLTGMCSLTDLVLTLLSEHALLHLANVLLMCCQCVANVLLMNVLVLLSDYAFCFLPSEPAKRGVRYDIGDQKHSLTVMLMCF